MVTIHAALLAVTNASDRDVEIIIKTLESESIGFSCNIDAVEGPFEALDLALLKALNAKQLAIVKIAQGQSGLGPGYSGAPGTGFYGRPSPGNYGGLGFPGAPVPGYSGAPVPECYGAPVPGYSGATVPGYYGAPVPGYYGAPVPGYSGAPSPAYYGAPVPGYSGAPVPGYSGFPVPGYYGAPVPGYYGAPVPGYFGAPGPGYSGAPGPDYRGPGYSVSMNNLKLNDGMTRLSMDSRMKEAGGEQQFHHVHIKVVDGLLCAAEIWKRAEEDPGSLKGYMRIEAVGHMGETSAVVFEFASDDKPFLESFVSSLETLALSPKVKSKHPGLLLEFGNGVSLLSSREILRCPKFIEPLQVVGVRPGLRKLFWTEVQAHEPSPLGRSSGSQVKSSSHDEEEE